MNREEVRRLLGSPLIRPAMWLEDTSVGAVLRDVCGQVGVECVVDASADRTPYDSNEFFAGSHRRPLDVMEYLTSDFGWHFKVNERGVVECWAPGHGSR